MNMLTWPTYHQKATFINLEISISQALTPGLLRILKLFLAPFAPKTEGLSFPER